MVISAISRVDRWPASKNNHQTLANYGELWTWYEKNFRNICNICLFWKNIIFTCRNQREIIEKMSKSELLSLPIESFYAHCVVFTLSHCGRWCMTPNDDVACRNLHIAEHSDRFTKSLKNKFLECKNSLFKLKIYRFPSRIFQKFKKYFVILKHILQQCWIKTFSFLRIYLSSLS